MFFHNISHLSSYIIVIHIHKYFSFVFFFFFVRDGVGAGGIVRDAQSRGTVARSLGTATRSRRTDTRGCTLVIAHERAGIVSYTDGRANDGRGGWEIWGRDLGVRTRVLHIKTRPCVTPRLSGETEINFIFGSIVYSF